jgi:hypothetical protein
MSISLDVYTAGGTPERLQVTAVNMAEFKVRHLLHTVHGNIQII